MVSVELVLCKSLDDEQISIFNNVVFHRDFDVVFNGFNGSYDFKNLSFKDFSFVVTTLRNIKSLFDSLNVPSQLRITSFSVL